MKKIYIFAAAALAFVACDKNDDTPISNTNVEARFSATIGESSRTRACDTKWAAGDKIGITTTFRSKDGPYINMEYATAGGNGIFTGNTIYIYNTMALTAYYPFSGTEGILPGILSASTTADRQTPDEQAKFDFLFASVPDIDTDHPDVQLDFAHKMSKITFIFTNGNDGTDVSKIIALTLDKLVLDGTFDTATGICKADNVAPQELSITLEEGSVSENSVIQPLIVFPQDLESVTLKIKDNENQYYVCNLNIEGHAFQSGNNYQYTINVSKTGLTLQKATITNWKPTTFQGNASSADDEPES